MAGAGGVTTQATGFLMREWSKFGKFTTLDVGRVEYYADKPSTKSSKALVMETADSSQKHLRIEKPEYELLENESWASEGDLRTLWSQTRLILEENHSSQIGFCQDKFGEFGRVVFNDSSCNFQYNLDDPEAIDSCFVLKMEDSEATEDSVDYEQENFELKNMLKRIIPQPPKKNNRKRSRTGVISLKPRNENEGGLVPLAAIVATDNGKRGKRIIDELYRIMKDKKHYLEGVGNHTVGEISHPQ